MIGFSIILLILVALIVIYLYKLAKRKPENFPPGPPRLPIWGSYWFLLLADYNFTHKAAEYLRKQYNSNVIGIYEGNYPVVIVTTHALAKEALSRDEFIGRPDVYTTRNRTLGELLGIVFTDGPIWKDNRRFALRQLRDYGFGRRFNSTERLYESEIKALIEFLQSDPSADDLVSASEDMCSKRGRVLMPDFFYALLSNTVLHMSVGQRFEQKELRELARSTSTFFRNIDPTGRAISITPWVRYFAPKYFGSTQIFEENIKMRDFFKKIVEQRKLTFSDDHKSDFLDTYLSKMLQLQKEGLDFTNFTEKQLIWTIADYFLPSPNVIGPSLSMLWMHLCMFPEIHVRVQEEVDRVVGRSRLPTLDDRKNMPYTEAVIRESLRFDPVFTINTARRCTEDTTLGGYFIPKNTLLLISIWNANHDPKVWTDPDVFKPERFLDDEDNLLKKDNILSFGGGKRLCVGETFSRNIMFLLLSGLLQNFTFTPAHGMPSRENKHWGFIVTVPPFWDSPRDSETQRSLRLARPRILDNALALEFEVPYSITINCDMQVPKKVDPTKKSMEEIVRLILDENLPRKRLLKPRNCGEVGQSTLIKRTRRSENHPKNHNTV
ncbi:hypothetical protein FQR65_LT07082 [Abscondita terminalis]|nr:hypothetical protein FQR65_LT07082 [Abscondita terminalis]